MKIARGLPLLTHIDFNSVIFTLEETLSFIDKCKSLREFRAYIYLYDLRQFDNLMERLDNDWQGEKKENFFESSIHMEWK